MMAEPFARGDIRRVGYYGGSFDPVHRGHLAIATVLIEQFEMDEFVFIPAYHAPHKTRLKPTSAYDRYAMLCLASQDIARMLVSRMEIEAPERPFTVDTLTRLNLERPDAEKFFVMGADSWMDITTWREWKTVLSLSNHIVITRPGIEIGFDHVTEDIRDRIVDLRTNVDIKSARPDAGKIKGQKPKTENQIYFTDSVNVDISATQIRRMVRENDPAWRSEVSPKVAKYLKKYQIYN